MFVGVNVRPKKSRVATPVLAVMKDGKMIMQRNLKNSIATKSSDKEGEHAFRDARAADRAVNSWHPRRTAPPRGWAPLQASLRGFSDCLSDWSRMGQFKRVSGAKWVFQLA